MSIFTSYEGVVFGIIGISILISIYNLICKSDIDYAIRPIIYNLSTMISFFVILFNYDRIYRIISDILEKYLGQQYGTIGIIKILGLGIVFVIIRTIFQWILLFINNIIFNGGKQLINTNKFLLAIFGVIFGTIRGIIFILMLFIPIILFNSVPNIPITINTFDNIYAYRKMQTVINNKTDKIIETGLIKDINANKIIYYNGVTLDQGVRSNNEINEKAINLTKKLKSDREKAKKLYEWIGTNIEYDDFKAEKVLNAEKVNDSGAISAFESRSGICFDYACLYVAMSRAVNLKVRLITGDAYNGKEFISHAWNQVYLEDENRWVNVDTTFFKAGNYFDTSDFNSIHKADNVAGEWSTK